MGGNALKETFTRRYAADEYFELCAKVSQRFSLYGFFSASKVIPAYRTKQTFGDMDIIYSTWDDSPLNVIDIKNMFPESKQISRNNDVISFEFEEFQIDAIHSPVHSYLYSLSYFSFNDCGNLVSKLARRFGLKHGHAGLYLPMRDEHNMVEEILISDDHDAMLDFVGLRSENFHSGFDTLEEMFEWVTSSKYFDQDAYAFENLTAAGRIRDKKRTTYNTFLKWLADKSFHKLEMHKDKTMYLTTVFDAFPDALPAYKEACQRLALQKYVKAKLNGQLVTELTGLTDKKLGQFMKELRKDFRFQSETLVYLSQSSINDGIMDKFTKFTYEV